MLSLKHERLWKQKYNIEMIENNLSDVERWQQDEDERLEYEGYCNKIRKGLEDLDEKSGERAL